MYLMRSRQQTFVSQASNQVKVFDLRYALQCSVRVSSMGEIAYDLRFLIKACFKKMYFRIFSAVLITANNLRLFLTPYGSCSQVQMFFFYPL